jgi:sugar phosphate isomerase/epimerase
MRKAISTYVFVKGGRLHSGMLDKLAGTGAQAIEIFAARSSFDYTDRQQVREIANWFKHSGVPLNSVHAPMFSDHEWGRTGTPPVNLVDIDKSRRVASMDEIKRALEVAEHVPFTYLIQHIGTPGEKFEPRKFEYALSSLEHLHAFARPLGVKLLLENIPNELATPERLLEYLHAMHFDDMGLCMDFGHANVMTNVADVFHLLKDHIRSTHIHDNHQERDEHLFPGEGKIDWNEAMSLLATAPHVPPVLLEINGEGRKDVVEKYQESFRLLERAAQAAVKG